MIFCKTFCKTKNFILKKLSTLNLFDDFIPLEGTGTHTGSMIHEKPHINVQQLAKLGGFLLKLVVKHYPHFSPIFRTLFGNFIRNSALIEQLNVKNCKTFFLTTAVKITL